MDFDPWTPKNRMGIKNGVPYLPENIFYLEAATWLGYGPADKYKPSITGHCPGGIRKAEDRVVCAHYIR